MANLVFSILLSAGIALGVWTLFNWVAATSDTGFAWLSVTVTVVAALFGLLVVGASFGTLFNPPSTKNRSRKDK